MIPTCLFLMGMSTYSHDWDTKQAIKAQIRNVIKDELKKMPSLYTHELDPLRDKIYEHIASTYDGISKSVYDEAG